MKSVMEEAPSIAKAIEQAWERVGKPREFTVKVFEEAKRSFFGFTKQSAKIALIFDERTLTEKPKPSQDKQAPVKIVADKQKFKKQQPVHRVHPQQAVQERHVEQTKKQEQDKHKQVHHVRKEKPYPSAKPYSSLETSSEKPAEKVRKEKTLWNDEMVNNARAWVQKNLEIIGLPNIKFNTSTQKYHLRFQFETCVLENKEKEKKLFSAFAHLIMTMLRNKFKKEFRGLKVVLSSN